MTLHPPGCGCKLESELVTNSKCLHSNINIPCITAFNELIPGSAQSVFKRYNQRLTNDSVKCAEDDELDECKLLINVPLLSPTSISHIIVISSRLSLKLDIYKSSNHLSLEDLEDLVPVQSLKLIQDLHGSILNPLKVAKFTNLSQVTLVFSCDKDGNGLEISYIGLRGTYQMNPSRAVNTVYEVRPNIADHQVQNNHIKLNFQMQ